MKFIRLLLVTIGILTVLFLLFLLANGPYQTMQLLGALILPKYKLIATLTSPDGLFDAHIIECSDSLLFGRAGFGLSITEHGDVTGDNLFYIFPLSYKSSSLKLEQLSWENNRTIVLERLCWQRIDLYSSHKEFIEHPAHFEGGKWISGSEFRVELHLVTKETMAHSNRTESWLQGGTVSNDIIQKY